MISWTVQRDPSDIEMERETTLRDAREWLICSLGLQGWEPPVGTPIAEAILHIRNDEPFKQMLAPVFDEMRDGDSLWLCRSRILGPLLGHRGIVLVQEDHPLVYIRMINY